MGTLRVVGDYLWDAALALRVDTLTSAEFHIPSLVLMETAGRGVADAVVQLDAEEATILVLAGLGNNGGDGLVAARYLLDYGLKVDIYLVGEPGKDPSPATAHQLQILQALDIRPNNYHRGCLRRYHGQDVILVDAVLGLGLKGPLRSDSMAMQALSEAATLDDTSVVAVDVPSGLDVDSGAAQELPLPADLTITFGALKPALAMAPARDAAGEVMTLEIGFPKAAIAKACKAEAPLLLRPDPAALIQVDPWQKLKKSAHKYDRGHVLVLGGSAGKAGAPLLAAMAALRTGAGWASVAMPRSAFDSLRGDVPREITFEELYLGESINPLGLEEFLTSRKVKAVVVGPGAMHTPLTTEVLAVLNEHAEEHEALIVLDAGATQNLEEMCQSLELDHEFWVATPHPGEWPRLGPSLQNPPLTPKLMHETRALAERLGLTLVYKGATPLVFAGAAELPVMLTNYGGLELARAGSGDVLSGIIAAHGAIGLEGLPATLRSLVQLGLAARLCKQERGQHSVLATDIIRHLGHVQAKAPALLAAISGENEGDDDDGDDPDEDDDGVESAAHDARRGPPPRSPHGGGSKPWRRR